MTLHACILLTGLVALSTSASAITADELIAKNIAARGGIDKLHAIASMHTEGKLRLGGGLEAKTETFALAPDRVRFEFTLQGLTAVNAWDGQQGWAIQPFQGRKDPQKTTPDDNKQFIEAADIAGPLVDYKAKGNKVEYLGTEDIDGTDAYKLRVTRKNGDTEVIYLDPDQYLEIRTVSHDMIRGQEQVQTIELGEYEKVDGVYFPFLQGLSYLPGIGPLQGQIVIEKAETNGKVDPQLFAFPVAAAKH